MPRRRRLTPRAAAFHEAGHAVARLHIGAPATAVQIVPYGYTRGSRRWPGRGQMRMWKWLLVLFAGSYAQAFETRRSLARTIRTSGKRDLEAAAPAVVWLVRKGYARTRMAALRRVHADTMVFLVLRWDAIDRVAAALLKDGKLTARQLRAAARM